MAKSPLVVDVDLYRCSVCGTPLVQLADGTVKELSNAKHAWDMAPDRPAYPLIDAVTSPHSCGGTPTFGQAF